MKRFWERGSLYQGGGQRRHYVKVEKHWPNAKFKINGDKASPWC